jgi:hypothetical protein
MRCIGGNGSLQGHALSLLLLLLLLLLLFLLLILFSLLQCGRNDATVDIYASGSSFPRRDFCPNFRIPFTI